MADHGRSERQWTGANRLHLLRLQGSSAGEEADALGGAAVRGTPGPPGDLETPGDLRCWASAASAHGHHQNQTFWGLKPRLIENPPPSTRLAACPNSPTVTLPPELPPCLGQEAPCRKGVRRVVGVAHEHGRRLQQRRGQGRLVGLGASASEASRLRWLEVRGGVFRGTGGGGVV